MAMNLQADLYPQIEEHIGHELECVSYAGENVAIECVTCATVLLDADIEDEDEDWFPR